MIGNKRKVKEVIYSNIVFKYSSETEYNSYVRKLSEENNRRVKKYLLQTSIEQRNRKFINLDHFFFKNPIVDKKKMEFCFVSNKKSKKLI